MVDILIDILNLSYEEFMADEQTEEVLYEDLMNLTSLLLR